MKFIITMTMKDDTEQTWFYDVEPKSAKKIGEEHAELLFTGIIKNYEVKPVLGLCRHERSRS